MLSLEICRYKYTNGECVTLDVTGQVEYMAWMHLCTTWTVTDEGDEDEDGNEVFTTNVTLFWDGEPVDTGSGFDTTLPRSDLTHRPKY